MKKQRTYEVIDTVGVIKEDVTSYGFRFSIENLDIEQLVENYDFSPHTNKRVRVIIMIEEKPQ